MSDHWTIEEDIKPLIDLWRVVDKNVRPTLNPDLIDRIKEVLLCSKSAKHVKSTYLNTADLTAKLRVAKGRARVYLMRYFTVPDRVDEFIYKAFGERFEDEMPDAYEEVKGKVKCSGPVVDPWMAWLCSGPVADPGHPRMARATHG